MRKKWSGEVIRGALRVLGYQIMFGFFGLMLTPSLLGFGDGLRIPLVSLLIISAGILMVMDGSYRGESDCAVGTTLDRLQRKGTYRASDTENARRYSPLKGVLSAVLGVLLVLLPAIYVAVTAQPFEYTLQDLPSWLESYTGRPEIGAPLAYLQGVRASAGLTEYLRVAVRFVLFLYVGLFGTMSDAQSLLFDRISPLLALVMPMLAAIGYLLGPLRHKRTVKAIEEAKRKPRKRLKKSAEKKQAPEEKRRLV